MPQDNGHHYTYPDQGGGPIARVRVIRLHDAPSGTTDGKHTITNEEWERQQVEPAPVTKAPEFEGICKMHPKYKGGSRPINNCAVCSAYWKARNVSTT